MNATELGLSVINDILSMPQREINNVDAIHFTNLVISLSPIDVFCHQFGSTEKHALEISIFIVVLDFNQQQRSFGIFGKHIHTVVLVELLFLITLAFQQFLNGNLVVQQSGQKAFKHGKVGLVTEKAFHRPVKTYIAAHTESVLLS